MNSDNAHDVPQQAQDRPAALAALHRYRAVLATWLAAPLEPDRYAAITGALSELERAAMAEVPAAGAHLRQLGAIQRELIQVIVEVSLPTGGDAVASVAPCNQLLELHAISLASLALVCGLTARRSRSGCGTGRGCSEAWASEGERATA